MLRVYIFTFVGEYVYFKLETDDEVKELPFNDEETIKDVIGVSNVSEFFISHKGKPLLWKELLVNIYMQTSSENPINVRKCIVWVSVDDSLPKKKRYRCFDTLGSLYDEKLYLVVFNTVQNESCDVREFSTTEENPLYVKTISKYVKLPEGVSIAISECDSMQNLFEKANLKDDYVVFERGEKSKPRDVHLHRAIIKGWEVEILKKSELIHNFAEYISLCEYFNT